jgi:hypothetical protein
MSIFIRLSPDGPILYEARQPEAVPPIGLLGWVILQELLECIHGFYWKGPDGKQNIPREKT